MLNWNGKRFLQPCLDALWAQTIRDFEVILIDNGSQDGSVELIKNEYASWLARSELPRLKLIEIPENTGFSGGNLAGLEHADPSSAYIATLNNDTVAAPDWLEKLVEALESAGTDFGAASSAMLFASDRDKIASAGIEIQRNGVALDRKIGEKWDKTLPSEEIFGVCAGAALYRRAAIATTGFFDRGFFAYLEDADLAWRLRLNGWRALYVPASAVWHAYSGTGGQGSPFKNFQLGRNRLWVIARNFPGATLRRHWWRIAGYDLAACAYTLLKGNFASTKGRLAALHPRELKRLRQERATIQRGRVVPVTELEKWLTRSATPLENLALRRAANELAVNSSQ